MEAQRDHSLTAQIVEIWPLVADDGEFVRAGSALLRVGRRLLAVQDDAWKAWWIDPRRKRLQPLVLKGAGQRKSRKRKPDLEAVCADRDGSIWILGSGSTPHRRRVARIERAGTGPVTVRKRPALYRALEAALGEAPNVEGSMIRRGRLWLVHRDTRGQGNALLEMSARALHGHRPGPVRLTYFSLGELASVALSFGDVLRSGSRWLYVASAEDSDHPVADGPVAGAALGLVDVRGARWTALREPNGRVSRRKFEGLVLDADCAAAWLITDPDEPTRPAELCRVRLSGFGNTAGGVRQGTVAGA